MPLAEDVNVKELAEVTDGFVGSDIEALCREAGMRALREDFNATKVKAAHFKEALKNIHPTVTPDVLKYYDKIAERFKKTTQISTSPRIGFT